VKSSERRERVGGAAGAKPPGPIEDVWQLHRSLANGAENFADERIANVDETTAHWIKLTATRDGAFEITNGRTGETTRYPAR
jgi:hypothetical protein